MVLVDYSRKLWKGEQRSIDQLPHVVQTIEDIEQLDDLYENLAVEANDFEKNPDRRKIMLFIDNYDAFTDESSRKKMAFFESMAGLVRKYQTEGIYMVVAGSVSITTASDDLRKVFAAPNFGIALKSADAVNRLYGKFPRSLADAELPMGRGFIVRSGITNMLQIATPYLNDEEMESSIDDWVAKILARHKQKKVKWMNAGTKKTAKDKDKAGKDDASGSTSKPSAEEDFSNYDMKAIKKSLIESGLTEEMVEMFSPADIVSTAKEMGLISDEE